MKERLLFVHFAGERELSSLTSLPTHITLVSWFRLDAELTGPLTEAARFIVSRFAPIHTIAGEEAMFGRNGDILVNVLRHGPFIQELHNALLSLVLEIGGEMESMEWSGHNYRPHITRKPDLAFSPGNEFVIQKLSLVRAVSEQPKVREVVEHFHL
jgi:hypothetical protein